MNNQDLLQLSEDRLERMDDVTIKSSTRKLSHSPTGGAAQHSRHHFPASAWRRKTKYQKGRERMKKEV